MEECEDTDDAVGSAEQPLVEARASLAQCAAVCAELHVADDVGV